MRRNEFSGTGQVFKFTLCQYLKAKSTIVAMLVMVLISMGSLLVAGMSMGEAAPAGGTVMYETSVMSVSEYFEKAEEVSFEAGFTVTYVYSIAVLILTMMSSSYIIRSVVEEKSSRLAETLVMSVSPMALIMGKILACLCLVLMQLLLLVLGGAAAAVISKEFFAGTNVFQMIMSTGALAAIKNLNAAGAFAVIVSILLGYFTFAQVAAISSACCDKMEDMGNATAAVLFPAMAGYLVGCMAPAFQGTAAAVMSIVPLAGTFVGPAKFLTGEVGFGVMCASWLVQILIIAILAVFGKRVYSELIISRGERVKMRRLLGMARGGGK